jgi:cytochrome c nitrite reductase small subunit
MLKAAVVRFVVPGRIEVNMKLPLLLAALAVIGVLALGLQTTNFTAYLFDNPSACNNCHVMGTVYEGWYHSQHRQWATCNDCHTPHDFIPKYFVKARSGLNHVLAFSTGHIPDAIRAKPSSRAIAQENCIRCHAETISDIMVSQAESGRYCFDCHRTDPHGVRGLSLDQ